jgi:steroid delta-isomerase-like uncharacterized protein
MTREDIVALFERRQQVMNQHDVTALSDMFSDDAVIESPTAGGTIRGRGPHEDVWHAVFNGFPDVVFSAEDLVIEGNRAVWITETRGTDTGGFMGLPPSGRPFRMSVVWVCTLDGGRIVHERRIYDFTGMLMQIGVLKAKPA